jgi:hypothetical protein
MGLSIQVGMVADLKRNDPEGCEQYREGLAKLSKLLVAAGLKPHAEPEELPEEQVWSSDMWGYSGLHRLRRVAAHLALGLPLPPPAKDDADDPVTERYYAAASGGGGGLLARLLGKTPRPQKLAFQHLILHSDAEGYYLPQDFPDVFFPATSAAIAGGMVGSAPRLLDECRRLATALGIPADLDPESDELAEAAESPDPAAEGWRRYPIETFGCVRLIAACEASLKTGAAIVFC